VYEQGDAGEAAAGADQEEAFVVPPVEEMTVLRQIAKMGNMRAIRERAEHLKELDPRYVPFANRLARLADGYQSRAIAVLVETYSKPREEHASMPANPGGGA
jgi:hypothetical protein